MDIMEQAVMQPERVVPRTAKALEAELKRRADRRAIIQESMTSGLKKPNKRQQKYMTYVMQGYSKKDAKKKAGYTGTTIEKAIETPAMKAILLSLKDRFTQAGIDEKYWVQKFKQWAESDKVVAVKDGEKILHADTDAQMKAFDRYREWTKDDGKGPDGKVSRRITLEEYVNQ